jgi:DNA polymerase-3 subunit gamma/tau
MAYVALYRQWRPQDFENLIGQGHISTTLKNAVATGKIAHAYLFAGPRGTGKTSTAKILAKALNCVDGPTVTPCNQCVTCERITTGTSMDVLEIDAASNRGIDEIRDLREAVKFAPVDGRYKVYIIDEVHMLTSEAFNALLKTLEEPPAHVVFVLATTEPHKIPATIHSRCQRYDFRRIPVSEIQGRLQAVADSSGLAVTPEALRLIAVHADGGLRDALSILDQCTALGVDQITAVEVRSLLGLVGHEWVWKLMDAMADHDAPGVLGILDQLLSLGKDARQVLLELALQARSLMLYKAAPQVQGLGQYGEDPKVLAEQSRKFSHEELVKIIHGLQMAANDAKWSAEPRITAEMALLGVCRRETEADLTALVRRIELLEAALAGKATTLLPKQPAAPKPPVAKTVPEKREAPPEQMVQAAASDPPAEIWHKVLQDLWDGGKRSVHACVSQGQLEIGQDGQMMLRFTSAFAKERSEKEDFRTMIEKALSQILGQETKIGFALGQAAVSPPKASVAETTVVEAQHHSLNQAVKMFPGKVIKEEI